jgi:hypothetical protein
MPPPPYSIADTHRFAGTFDVETDGSRGAITLEPKAIFLHAHGAIGSDERFGLGMSFAGRLVVAYGPRDKVEIGAYRVDGDRLDGLWVPPGASSDDCAGCGSESSISEGDGVWRIDRAVAIDGSAYHGTLTIAPMQPPNAEGPRAVRMQWKLHDGDYSSFGIAFADAIYTTFSFEPEKPYAVAVYEPDSSCAVLDGVWLGSDEESLRRERLRRR